MPIFLPRSWEIVYKTSQDAGEEIGLAADGVKEEATIEASVGGDGTLNGVVRGVTEELEDSKGLSEKCQLLMFTPGLWETWTGKTDASETLN